MDDGDDAPARISGLVTLHVDAGTGTMIEVCCRSDRVAARAAFQALAQCLLEAAVAVGAADLQRLMDAPLDGGRVRSVLAHASAALDEPIAVRRIARLEGGAVAGCLLRNRADLPAQTGALLATDRDWPLAAQVARHVAVLAPLFLGPDDVPDSATQARPGRVLLEQPFTADPRRTVGAVMDEAGVRPVGFARFRLGG